MLVAAAVCPHPPLLVPGVAAGASAELDGLRAAASKAVEALLQAEPDLVVVVGESPVLGPCHAEAWGSLQPFGFHYDVGPPVGEPSLPLSLTIGRWLVAQHAPDVTYTLFGVPADSEAQRCAQLGAAVADRAPRVALLAMGDGSARRSLKGPGYLDGRAETFDDSAIRALGAADAQALLALDSELAAELLVAGRASWQVLAGAAGVGTTTWTGDVQYAAAPYGVTYIVATWLPSSGDA